MFIATRSEALKTVNIAASTLLLVAQVYQQFHRLALITTTAIYL